MYKRVLIKLSGEALAGSQGYGIDPVTVDVKGGRFTIGRDEVLGMANAQVANPRSNRRPPAPR